MDFNHYQDQARLTAIYPSAPNGIINPYPFLGLAGESGECAEKCKKIIRDNGGAISIEKRNEICKELGDVLWYVANIASDLGIHMNDIASINIEKLKKRQEENKIKGSGDNR